MKVSEWFTILSSPTVWAQTAVKYQQMSHHFCKGLRRTGYSHSFFSKTKGFRHLTGQMHSGLHITAGQADAIAKQC